MKRNKPLPPAEANIDWQPLHRMLSEPSLVSKVLSISAGAHRKHLLGPERQSARERELRGGVFSGG